MNKKITLTFLIISMIIIGSFNLAYGAELLANPFVGKVLVNKIEVKIEAYNIKGNNYFKLRDLAMVLKDSEKKFQVKWDEKLNKIVISPGISYTPVGGELLTNKRPKSQNISITKNKLFLVDKEINLDAFTIDGYNYFKLRDIGKLLDFSVDWEQESKTIDISTFQSYNKTDSVFKDFQGKWSKDEKEIYEFFQDGIWKLSNNWGNFEGNLRTSKLKEGFFIMVGKEEEKLDESEIEEPVYLKVILKGTDNKYKKELEKHGKIILGTSEYGEMILYPTK